MDIRNISARSQTSVVSVAPRVQQCGSPGYGSGSPGYGSGPQAQKYPGIS